MAFDSNVTIHGATEVSEKGYMEHTVVSFSHPREFADVDVLYFMLAGLVALSDQILSHSPNLDGKTKGVTEKINSFAKYLVLEGEIDHIKKIKPNPPKDETN